MNLCESRKFERHRKDVTKMTSHRNCVCRNYYSLKNQLIKHVPDSCGKCLFPQLSSNYYLYHPDYGDTVFLAALQSSISSTADPVLFDWEVINHGGHYNPSTGEYTVPYDGIHHFHTQMQGDLSTDTIWLTIQVDGSESGSHRDAWLFEEYRSATVLLELQAGQAVNVYMNGGAEGSSTYLYTYFSGYMISAN